jgi:hypothetical protein
LELLGVSWLAGKIERNAVHAPYALKKDPKRPETLIIIISSSRGPIRGRDETRGGGRGRVGSGHGR